MDDDDDDIVIYKAKCECYTFVYMYISFETHMSSDDTCHNNVIITNI